MNNRLKEALEYISKSVSISESIGTNQQKTLHQTIKYYLSLNEEEHEVKLDKKIVDIYKDNEIYQRQLTLRHHSIVNIEKCYAHS